MTSAELTDWMAYERVYGPVLVHDRIDIGLAQVCLVLVKLLGQKSKHTLRDFLPAWWQEVTQRGNRQPEAVRQGFEALMKMAEDK